MEEKFQLIHPDSSKKLGRIDAAKYQQMKTAMLKALKGKTLNHTDLMQAIHDDIDATFDGATGWYAQGVKLDLEARKIIIRTSEKPQRYHLA